MKKKTKEEWSEISFSSSEVTYYDFIVKEKDLDTIEKISNQISDLIAGGESDSTSHLVIGDLNRFNDKTLSHNHISVESSGWKFGECFDYTIENKGKLVKSPKKGEFVFLFDYVYDHADYVLTKNENFKNICFKVKSFNNRAVLVERDDPGFELTANDASDASEPGLTIICSNGLTFEGSVEGKDDLIKEFHTYLIDKRKRTSKEKDKYSLIKIKYLSIFQDVEDWDDDDEVPTQKATDYCVVKVKAFIDELKEKVDGITEEKILISGLGDLENSDLYKSKSRSILAIYNKIIEKKSFVLTDGKTAKLSFSKIAIDMEIPENFKNAKAEDLEAIAGIVAGKKPGKKKFIFTDGTKEYKITDLKEAIDFDSINQASSYNSKDFHELSELKNTVKQSYLIDDFAIYILLTKEMLGKELNSIFLSMSDYGFTASYITATDSSDLWKYLVKKYSMPHRKADQIANSIVNYAEKKKKKLNELNIDELKKIEPKLTIEILKKFKGEIITQIYDKGEYDTGYFAVWAGLQGADGDAEQYVSKENDSPGTKMSLEEYNKVLKMLLE